MKYCPYCGSRLSMETAGFCSECGKSLQVSASHTSDNTSVSVANTKGEVFGTGISGNGNIFGKEVSYTVNGSVFILNSMTDELMEKLTRIKTIQTQVEAIPDYQGKDHKNIEKKQEVQMQTKHQINQVLDDVDKISKKEGREIQEIRAGVLQITTKELGLKEIILKGNEHFYKNEYSEAITWYDKALQINPNNFDVCFNKGYALAELDKDNESIEWYEKALKINPKNSDAWNNKGSVL